MNLSRLLPAIFLGLTAVSFAADSTASDLASKLSALRQDGASYVRLRMDTKGGTLQLQIKQRMTRNSSEVVYQILFPKDRKGEAVLLKRTGRSSSGSVFLPPNTVKPIGDMKDSMFGSDLTYEDIIDNFYGWDQQAIVGTETIDGVNCEVLESKPGKGDRSSYGSVKSWIDLKRMVPMRIEKFSGSGQLVRRIDTTRVVADAGHHIPANLAVTSARQGSTTQIDGSRIKHDVNYTDADFSVEGLKEMAAPKSGAAEQ